ncbi:hypothetical protein DPMN_150417 [Dreissena polymorpha]|uniref:Uncharacterized protein n=1 Tax=Dreissena polymorpha TaxID=45954 RepID=A0A9D4FEK2_DREPO|nr:hypothetical protein DPMN_150417 [Dreissena polymorpha]
MAQDLKSDVSTARRRLMDSRGAFSSSARKCIPGLCKPPDSAETASDARRLGCRLPVAPIIVRAL